MKKIVSIFCVLALILSVAAVSAVSAGAEDVKKGSTAVDVKSGDEVSYSLFLENVELPIIGSDFSVYYDSSVFDLVSVADFNNKTNEDEWEATINPDLDGQVRGVWSILKGVDFSSKRNFLTVNLKAKADANNTHITYRVRYLYDDNVFNSAEYPQITDYLFTCNLTLNGEEVLENAAPEVDVEQPEENGKFVSSYDGNGEHADASIPGVVDKKKASGSGSNNNNSNDAGNNNSGGGSNNGGGSDNGSGSGSNGGSAGSVSGGNNSGGSAQGGGSKTAASANAAAPAATTADGKTVISTDAQGNITATAANADNVTTTGKDQGGVSPVLWIIIALVVLAGGGAAAYFYMKKKPAEAENAAEDAKETTAEAKDAPAEEKAEEAPAEEVKEAPAEEAKEAPAEEAEEAPAEEAPAESEEQE